MGGRGISAGSNNQQVDFATYLLRKEIEQVHNEFSSFRQTMQGVGAAAFDPSRRIGEADEKKTELKKRCACCNMFSLPAYSTMEKCSICGWIDDPRQNMDENLTDGANCICLPEAKRIWRATYRMVF